MCKTSLGQMISVQFCHKSLKAWLGGKGCGATALQYFIPLVNFKDFTGREDGSYKKILIFFLKNALMIHRNVKSKSILAAGKVVHFEWKDKMCMKIGDK